MFMRFINICEYEGFYLSVHRLQLFLQVASCLLILLLLLQQGVLFHLQLADLAAQVQLLTRLLLPQFLHARPHRKLLSNKSRDTYLLYLLCLV